MWLYLNFLVLEILFGLINNKSFFNWLMVRFFIYLWVIKFLWLGLRYLINWKGRDGKIKYRVGFIFN